MKLEVIALKSLYIKKKCLSPQSCKTTLQENSKIVSELRSSILSKATTLERERKDKKKK